MIKQKIKRHTIKKHARMYKLLGNPKRLEILYRLCNGECSLKELEEMLGARKTNTVQHLGLMKLAGIVRVRYQYGGAIYSIVDNRLISHGQIIDVLELD